MTPTPVPPSAADSVTDTGPLTQSVEQAAPLQAILRAHPATGEIYENMNYEISGLSRSPLERSVATEMLATQVLHKIAQAALRG